MLTRLLTGATMLVALIACALLPAWAAPKLVVSGGGTGTVTHEDGSTGPLDYAVQLVRDGGLNHWTLHYADPAIGVDISQRHEHSIHRLDGPAMLDGQPVAWTAYGYVTQAGQPTRDLFATLAVARGYTWNRGKPGANYPDAVNLRLQENTGTALFPNWVIVLDRRFSWLGTRPGSSAEVWTATGGYGIFTSP